MMINSENPVREGHWVSTSLNIYLSGKYPKSYYTLIRAGGKIVGKVQDGVFFKRLIGSLHFLRIPPGIANDIASLKQAENAGAQIVQVTDIETETIYRAAISTIWARGFPVNRGYGPQIGLVFSDWSKGNEPLCDQLLLWGER